MLIAAQVVKPQKLHDKILFRDTSALFRNGASTNLQLMKARPTDIADRANMRTGSGSSRLLCLANAKIG
tara:strand:- start:33 stop:239 length:207 start_codon:yes stop_codon:yes gene_type:complete